MVLYQRNNLRPTSKRTAAKLETNSTRLKSWTLYASIAFIPVIVSANRAAHKTSSAVKKSDGRIDNRGNWNREILISYENWNALPDVYEHRMPAICFSPTKNISVNIYYLRYINKESNPCNFFGQIKHYNTTNRSSLIHINMIEIPGSSIILITWKQTGKWMKWVEYFLISFKQTFALIQQLLINSFFSCALGMIFRNC